MSVGGDSNDLRQGLLSWGVDATESRFNGALELLEFLLNKFRHLENKQKFKIN